MKRIVVALCVVFATALLGCGDDGNETPAENCSTPGDEDGNGKADCDDPVCAASCAPVCGNGKKEAGEACDDGNTVNGDGCDNNCTETGCGNGVMTMDEGCDDGNTTNGDGCDVNCVVTGCGNGIMTAGEACDDGNTINGDGCDNNCTVTACGNGVMSNGEACDDGNAINGDGCDSNCTATACGNGVMTAGEACDDGNTIDGDGCDSNCTATACGNGVVTGTEVCDDGNTTNGDGCDNNCTMTACGNGVASPGEACDDGNTTNGDGCDNNCTATACGNGIMTGTEACDDGNTINGDGCDNNCTVTACGNGIMTGTEACDDGNAINGDGCDSNCTVTACGNGIMTGTEACDDGNTINGDGCDMNCTPTGCGNGVVTAGEECDDGNSSDLDGCTSECTLVVCGDGVVEGAEVCDDGNTINGDGCDMNCTPTGCGNGVVTTGEACDDGNAAYLDGCTPACVVEPTEVEPNEDGTPSTGGSTTNGNDFGIAGADANGAFTGSVTILAALTPAGDEDVFKFTNTGSSMVELRLDVWNRALGINVPCGTSIDTALRIRDAAGTSLAVNDDRNGASDRCSAISFPLAAGATVYAHLIDYGDDNVIAGYALQARYLPVVCGDSVIGPGEQCDDGNANDGDGCSSTCQIEIVCGNAILQTGEQCDDGNTNDGDGCSSTCQYEGTAEVEPNNTIGDAAASPLQITGDTRIVGSIAAAGDKDVFQLTVAAPTMIRFESFTSLSDCNKTIDLRLFDAVGMPIIADTSSAGVGGCGALVFPLNTGTYFIGIEDRGNNDPIATYLFDIDYQTDKGAELEPANMMGVNDTIATAETGLGIPLDVYVFGDHTLNGDVDVYAITVPPSARIRAEVIEGDRSVETCESNGIDSLLRLFNAAGTQVAEDDDDGRGFCSMIDGTGASPNDSGARNTSTTPQTFYLMVRQSTLASAGGANFVYRLQVSLRY